MPLSERVPSMHPKRPAAATPEMIVATWFGCGLSPKAPGTVGSLGALPFAWMILAYGDWVWLAGAVVAASLIGIAASRIVLRKSGIKDPSFVVIDEVAGQWLALLPAGLNPYLFVAGFSGLPPVRYLETLAGRLGRSQGARSNRRDAG